MLFSSRQTSLLSYFLEKIDGNLGNDDEQQWPSLASALEKSRN